MFPVLIIAVAFAGVALTALVAGRAGLRDLRSRLGRWRVEPRWYAMVLLPPGLILAVLFSLRTLVSPVFTPNLFPLGLLFGLAPGFLEEMGWMGFAFPRLQEKRSPLAAGILLGVLWGLWHMPVVDSLGAAAPHGAYWLPFFLAFIAAMTALRVLIVWVYTNTNSVLLAQLLHASSTGSLVIFGAAQTTPAQETFWYALYALTLWVVVAIVVHACGKELVRRTRPVASASGATSLSWYTGR
jgi:membrane protease YdiL (CAAX protease family)